MKFNINDLPHKELKSLSSGEVFSASAVLTDYLGFKELFVHHEIITPGKRSSPPHCHTQVEEMVFVLLGNPTVHNGNEEQVLKPGDFVGFKPLAKTLHYIENKTSSDIKILMICSRATDDEVKYGASPKE